MPVGTIAGAAFWIAAPQEPAAWIGPVVFAAGAAFALILSFWPGGAVVGAWPTARRAAAAVFALIAAAGIGACACMAREAIVAHKAYAGSAQAVEIRGWVFATEASDGGPRLRLLVRSIEGAPHPPRFVRLSVPEAGLVTPGRTVWCRAVLGPPPGPLSPGAYDFARRAYFDRLAATGFSYGRCRPDPTAAPTSWFDRQRLQLAAVQSDLGAAIRDAAPGRGGAIAAALVTGDRSGIDEETNDAFRDSGLGHLLSVSGVHMAIVGGLVFAALLWSLSLIGPLALRLPVKKIAAIGALIALAAYYVISGASVPALRSFIQAGVAFGAILLDRPAISMRGLALATFIVVLIFPESVVEPGFQMSFAATMALVALFEMLAARRRAEPALPSPGLLIGSLQWVARGVGGVMLISVVAGLATDPFAVYHFQRFSVYALVSNLIVEPIISFLVAPAAAIAAVLASFGQADIPLQVMSSALELVAAVGEIFGSRPEAVRALPQPPDLAFILWVSALLWACLWRGWVRWGGVLLFAAGVLIYVQAPRPLVAFDGDLRAVYAHNDAQNRWVLMARNSRSTYARDRLGASLGLSPPEIEALAPAETCGEHLCAWRTNAQPFVLVRDANGFSGACQPGAIVIARAVAPSDFSARCTPRMLIDAGSLAEEGGGLITPSGTGFAFTRAWPPTVRRPWTPRHTASEDQE